MFIIIIIEMSCLANCCNEKRFLKLRMHKSISRSTRPEPAGGGAYGAPPDPLAGFKVAAGKDGKETAEKGQSGEERSDHPHYHLIVLEVLMAVVQSI